MRKATYQNVNFAIDITLLYESRASLTSLGDTDFGCIIFCSKSRAFSRKYKTEVQEVLEQGNMVNN